MDAADHGLMFQMMGYGTEWAHKSTNTRRKKRREWWGSMSHQNRAVWLISLQREDDQRRFKRLCGAEMQRRNDPVDARLAVASKAMAAAASAKHTNRKAVMPVNASRLRGTGLGRPPLK